MISSCVYELTQMSVTQIRYYFP
uniref:Uncharacterized protein n=1 Tax=Anguilla anguilla TaxID=7936 RepID=A0A0E9VD79_ANGAN